MTKIMTKIVVTIHPIKSILLTSSLVASLVLLSGCLATTGSSRQDSASIYGDSSGQSAEYYLAEASKYQGAEQADWKLKAAAAHAQNQQFPQAYRVLLSFQPTQLRLDQRNAYYLLKGESALRQQKSFEAIRALQAVSQPENQSLRWNRHYQLITADALHLNKRYVDAAVKRIEAQNLLDNQAQLDEQFTKVWQELSESPQGALELKRNRSQDPEVLAWLDLAITHNQYQQNPRLLAEGLRSWGKQYGNHPALQYAPDELIRLSDSDFIAPRKVGLIVPLSGRFASVGGAIRDGFVAGYFNQRQQRGELPQVQIYDSANGDSIERIYQQALTDGVEMVVGPLLKRNIDQLARFERMPIPTLVLNQLQTNVYPANFYQFGLPVEDEAAQIARYAMRKGQQRAFVINAEASVGHRAVASFVETYEELGGTVVQAADISRNQDPKEAITRLLGVDQIEKRSNELQNLLNIQVEYSSQGSANADVIFLIAKAKKARIIKPYLNYYYAYNLPVYATSDIYSGKSNSRIDNDLSGIMFTDAPWMLGSSSEISKAKQRLAKTMPEIHRSSGRFFALGHDAYMLIPELGQLSALSDSAIEGLSGILSMDGYGRIKRQLAWGQYVKGQVKAVR